MFSAFYESLNDDAELNMTEDIYFDVLFAFLLMLLALAALALTLIAFPSTSSSTSEI